MNTMQRGVDDYLKLRRALGYKLDLHGPVLRDFAAFMRREGAPFITTKLALRWAIHRMDVRRAQWAKRLGIVRSFAKHWSATDPRTEIPPPGLLPYRPQRRTPYLYSDEEVRRLIEAARALRPRSGLRPWTYSTLFGLLAITGLRISEALALDCGDVDSTQGVLTIRRTKFGKSRMVPVHPSTQYVLQQYARRRDRLHPRPQATSFFVSDQGKRLTKWTVRWTFVQLSQQIGLRRPSDRYGPRLHDFRHAFSVRTLVRWYRAGLDVERRMLALSTYLGHTHVADTYWYLSAAPELLEFASARLEKSLGDLP
jgi:integrase/recombinase XerD